MYGAESSQSASKQSPMGWSQLRKSLLQLLGALELGHGQVTAEQRETEVALCSAICGAISERSSFSDEQNERELFENVLRGVFEHRLTNEQWLNKQPTTIWLLSHAQLGRILLRDAHLQEVVFKAKLHNTLTNLLRWLCVSSSAERMGEMQFGDALRAVLRSGTAPRWTMGGDAQQQPHAAAVQQAGLQVLATLSEHSDSVRAHLCQTNAIDHALALMSHADLVTQKLCACLLRVLCCEPDARETIKVYDGVRTLVSALCTRNVRLQWHVAWALAQLAEDADTAAEMGQLGAVALVLAELADECAWEGTGPVDDRLAMCTGLCAILAHLGQIDSLATLIVQTNGIHVLAKLLMLHCRVDHLNNNTNYTLLQCSALRALRVLFSLERNRQYFKRLFPHEFFCQFIDVGHYIQEMAAYEQLLVHFRLSLETSELEMQRGLESVNLRRQPLGAIGQYLLLEQLGAGAFGCVYRVKKERTEGHYALKEIFMQANSVNGDMINEIKIIRTRMRHPNVVRYRKVFVENDKLYILMDLIDGASLKDHVNSVKEKGLRFSEERIWNIIIQIVLAIKYLHKEKRIVHRDLKPNNIMLADNDKVVITDFGLAKERGDSYLKSNAGTIMYSCPEIVQDQPYGEKADIWSFGCCVYEMCALSPPFNSTNMLQLASAGILQSLRVAPVNKVRTCAQIVEAKYEALDTLQQPSQEPYQDASNSINTDATNSPGVYTSELTDMIYACLTADAAARPDIIGVAGLMTGQLVVCIDEIIRAQYAQMQQVNRAGRQRVSQARCGRKLRYRISSNRMAYLQ